MISVIHIATDAPRAQLHKRIREDRIMPSSWLDYTLTVCDLLVKREDTTRGKGLHPTAATCVDYKELA